MAEQETPDVECRDSRYLSVTLVPGWFLALHQGSTSAMSDEWRMHRRHNRHNHSRSRKLKGLFNVDRFRTPSLT
jgi:hypothetical protein